MKKLTLTLAALAVAATGGVAYAEPSFSITGMIRQEIANNTGGANQHTSWGSPFNGKMTTSHLGNLAPNDDGRRVMSGPALQDLCWNRSFKCYTTRAGLDAVGYAVRD